MQALEARWAGRQEPPITLDTALTLWFFKNARNLRIVDGCIGWRCGQCHTARSRARTAAERADMNHSGLVGPILVGTFAALVLVGCCLACATNEGTARRKVMLGKGETMPLLATQLSTSSSFRGVMPKAAAAPAVAAP